MRKYLRAVKNQLLEIRQNHNQLLELEWAHVYHDSIRGIPYLQNLSLSVGRWAGNYAFFYVLHRILRDFKPEKIVEFGLGESTRFISTYMDHHLKEGKHVVVEHDSNWRDIFESGFTLSERSTVKLNPIGDHKVNGKESLKYLDLDLKEKFDLYIVDGPFGRPNYSRYNIVEIAQTFEKGDEFIIILDDYHRKGEQMTGSSLEKVLSDKKIEFKKRIYKGNKDVALFATPKYAYTCSL